MGTDTQADGTTSGREGLSDAPAPMGKQWAVLAGVLTTLTAGVAIMIGTGIVSGEGPEPLTPPPTATQDGPERTSAAVPQLDGIQFLTVAKGACLEEIVAADEESVLYERQTPDYAAVVVAEDGMGAMCLVRNDGIWVNSFDVDAQSAPLVQFVAQSGFGSDGYNALLSGRVAHDVEAVQVISQDEVVGEADVQNGFFTALVTMTPGDELAFGVTSTDGTSTTVVADDASVDRIGQLLEEQLRSLTEMCSTENDVVTAQVRRNYLFTASVDDEMVQGCIGREGNVWTATLPATMPVRAPIVQMSPTPGPTDKGAFPVMGLTAPSVTEVTVISTDGNRRDAYVKDGFYSLMLPAADAVDLTYVVNTEDGQRTTLGSE